MISLVMNVYVLTKFLDEELEVFVSSVYFLIVFVFVF